MCLAKDLQSGFLMMTYSSIKNIQAQQKALKADKTQFKLKRTSNRQVYFSKETS